MSQEEIFEQVVKILTPYVKNQEALDSVGLATHILDELKVNSARLVDVVVKAGFGFGDVNACLVFRRWHAS